MSDNQSSSLKSYVDSATGAVQSGIGSLTGNTADQVCINLSLISLVRLHCQFVSMLSIPHVCPTIGKAPTRTSISEISPRLTPPSRPISLTEDRPRAMQPKTKPQPKKKPPTQSAKSVLTASAHLAASAPTTPVAPKAATIRPWARLKKCSVTRLATRV